MRRLMMLVTVVLLMAAMVMLASPASAQGGCQSFGHSRADDAQEFRPVGQNAVSGAAPLNDEIHTDHENFCG